MKIERFGLGHDKKPVSEGYYAVAPDGALVLMPPTAQLRADVPYRLATQGDLDRLPPFRYATMDDIASADMTAAQLIEAKVPPKVEAEFTASGAVSVTTA